LPIKNSGLEETLGSDEWLQSRAGESFCIRIPATLTDKAYSVTEILANPGNSTPLHRHENEDEHFLILEGTVRFLYGEESFEHSTGHFFSAKRGIPHAWGNATDSPARMLITLTPGGCEDALRQIALAGDGANVLEIAAQFGVSILGPPLLG
jgi:quercetin dioxygenase-like cupin family protein